MGAENTASRLLAAGRGQVARPIAALPDQPPEPPAESTSRLVAEEPKPALLAYVKTSAFITPDQRSWLSEVVARAKLDGIDGISGSDVIRLALARLKGQTTAGLILTDELIAQALAEAEQFPGRKNRGLPQARP